MLVIYSIKLVLRIAVLILAILIHLNDKHSLVISNGLTLSNGIKPLHFIWLIFAAEMVQKLFPNQLISLGCRKQFKSSYLPAKDSPSPPELTAAINAENRAAKKVLAAWFGGNALVGILYYAGLINEADLVLLSLVYFVGDLICVLFFCPFQYFLMKNRCCITCRIFNWDAIMFVTPLLFINSFYSLSLALLALLLLIYWELCYRRHPERFLEVSNTNLRCQHCTEKLCKLKKVKNLYSQFGRHLPHR